MDSILIVDDERGIRDTLRGVDVRECIWQLRLMDMPVRRIAEWIDDWFTGYLPRYTRRDVTIRLDELGFTDTRPLDHGVTYDTSQRRLDASAREQALMGDGDVRHFCRKVSVASADRFRLPDPPDGKGSPYDDAPAVTQFREPLDRIVGEAAQPAVGLTLQARRQADLVLIDPPADARVLEPLGERGPRCFLVVVRVGVLDARRPGAGMCAWARPRAGTRWSSTRTV